MGIPVETPAQLEPKIDGEGCRQAANVVPGALWNKQNVPWPHHRLHVRRLGKAGECLEIGCLHADLAHVGGLLLVRLVRSGMHAGVEMRRLGGGIEPDVFEARHLPQGALVRSR